MVVPAHPGRAGRLRALGAEPIVLDALDAAAVREAVAMARPEAIIYQATARGGCALLQEPRPQLRVD